MWLHACLSAGSFSYIFGAYMIGWSKGWGLPSFLIPKLHSNEKGWDYRTPPPTHTYTLSHYLLLFRANRMVWFPLCKQCPWGPLKDGNGDGKRIKVRPGWWDGAVLFRGVIKEPFWLTLSLTSKRKMEAGDYRVQAGASEGIRETFRIIFCSYCFIGNQNHNTLVSHNILCRILQKKYLVPTELAGSFFFSILLWAIIISRANASHLSPSYTYLMAHSKDWLLVM